MKLRLDRLQEYPRGSLERVCASLGLGLITAESLMHATPSNPSEGHNDKNSNHLGRIRFLFENPSDADIDAIVICNGMPDRQPELDEPHFFDGRHRYLAAVLRGDSIINVVFRWGNQSNLPYFLSRPVIAYLTGDSDVKPKGTWHEWQDNEAYVDYY